MSATVDSTVPGHPGKHQSHSAGAGNAGEEEPTAKEERQDCEPEIDGKRQNCTGGNKRANNNLNLPHEREHPARTTVDGKSGVDPGLRAALDQNAVVTSGKLELHDGFSCTRACLAEDIDGPTGLMPREDGFNIQLVKRNQSCARHMCAGIFWSCANIQQLMGLAGRETVKERGGRDCTGVDTDHI